LDRQKNAAIPAIRVSITDKLTQRLAVFCHFGEVSAIFLCQGSLFRFREKTALASKPLQSQKDLSGRESAPGAREKRELGRATRLRATGKP
jgi:hypothetical protein